MWKSYHSSNSQYFFWICLYFWGMKNEKNYKMEKLRINTYVDLQDRSTTVTLIGSLTGLDAMGFKKEALKKLELWPDQVNLDLSGVTKS